MIQELQLSINELYYGLGYLLPEGILALGVFLLLGIKIVFKKEFSFTPYLLPTFLLIAFGCLALQIQNFKFTEHLFEGLFVLNLLVLSFKALLLIIAVFIICIHITEQENPSTEFDILFLSAVLSALLLISSSNLLMVFLSLEMFSLCSYAMVASISKGQTASESSLKYILFGLFSSALMLFGLSILYGITHTLDPYNLDFITNISLSNSALITVVIVLCASGLLFKISSLPFQFYIPDVFQGTSLSMVGFLSTFSKIAGFIILFRFIQFFESGFFNYLEQDILSRWKVLIGLLSIITLVWANLAALWQNNLRRLLAYASIAQTGFILMSIFVFTDTGKIAFSFYVISYCIANLGLIWSLLIFKKSENLSDLSGLGQKYPILGVFISIFIISLIGIPVSMGFNAKFAVFSAVFESFSKSHASLDMTVLSFGVISTVVSLVYYIKIPYYLFFKTSDTTLVFKKYYFLSYFAIIILGISILYFGLFPNAVLDLIKNTLYRI